MEDQRAQFIPMITEDRTPGSVVIFSPRLVEKIKARRDAEKSAAGSNANEQNTPTTS